VNPSEPEKVALGELVAWSATDSFRHILFGRCRCRWPPASTARPLLSEIIARRLPMVAVF
jgi:hypothetical protein